ncbi:MULTISPECIES: pentapeptide repeat-containing protein [Nostoc]|uniref:Pentapeptide repeat-containing protein n=2 Tax=Nostoc TaxID=1177 RepID=A0ABR8IG48_9NOSO|nr:MULTISPECIES: pentapeptide repeat-containing protein [Nostoc]MBD2565628.1 pentapeptide repeat-containing protein [Nostoc linckia FACHB-391]MBD2650159.1 pentapeptide repeat-containing protein [Nostoc foliaceum FACHB-393]
MSQDFSGRNLRGRSFKGQNLEGVNFSGADIRGADFTGANLKGANFSHATAGLQRHWAIFLVCVSLLLSGFSGILLAFAHELINIIFDSSSQKNQIAGWAALIVIIVAFIVILRQGFNSAVVGAIPITFAAAIAGAIAGARTIVFAGVMTGVLVGTIGIAIAGAIAGAIVDVGAGLIVVIIGTAILAAIDDITAAIMCAGCLFISYIVLQAMEGDEKYSLIWNIAVAFAASGGTSFYNADLTDANFTAATLKSTDFRKANLTRTCFNKTKKLDLVRPGTTYLQKAKVVNVLVTGQGQDKNFDRDDLRGVNFQEANLVDASFIGADLSGANLQDADLSRAKLVQTQLNGTDLTGATLTGAYIQDWGITTDTKFDGVRCEYVYMRLPTKENPDPLRKPDNHKEVFADGEFGDFIQPIFDTLDLYHNQGVDPRAIAISFKQLAENHPEAELEIVAMEKRGQDKFLLRAKTAGTADKSQLSAEYFDSYNQLKGLPEREIKLLLAEKDNQIRRLENMVMTALERPSFYSNTQIEKVNTMTNNPGGISQNVSGGSVNGGMQAAQGNNNVQTSTTYSSPEQKQNLAEAAAEIQQLLDQLSQSYPTETMSGKMALATEATQRIENNPTLMQKTISALRAGGTAALEQALSHPAASFVIAALDDWNKNNQ